MDSISDTGSINVVSKAVVMFDDLSMGGKMRNLVIMMISNSHNQ